MFATAESVKAQGFDSIVPNMLSNLGDVLIGVVLILVLSASMSTLSSLVLTSSSTLTLDFIGEIKNKRNTEKGNMLMMRFFVAVFIVISASIAIVQAKSRVTFIAQLMGISWGALSGAFLAPFLYGLYWKKTSKAAVCVSFCFATIVELVQLFKSLGMIKVSGAFLTFIFRNSLYSGAFCMLAGLAIVPLVSLLTQVTKPENVDNMFACYDKQVMVPAREILTEEDK